VTTLVLCGVSMLTVPLGEVVRAARAANFDGLTVLARSHRRALERDGLTTPDLRRLVADAGLVVTDVEATGDWLGAEPDDVPARLRTTVYATEEIVDIAAELGARTLTAVHAGAPQPLDSAAHAFAQLCDRAAGAGLQVALEFVPWMGIDSLATAWNVVRTADRRNGGLLVDVWHHRRSSHDDELLRAVPAEKIFSVQVCDATAEPLAPLAEDVQYRMLPGRGELGVVDFLRILQDRGVDAPIGIEVFDAELAAGYDIRPTIAVTKAHVIVPEIMDAVRRLLARVRAGELARPPRGDSVDSARVSWL